MALLAALAVFVFAPQDPTPAAAGPAPAVVLQQQEALGKTADARALAGLTLGDDAAVAARAAWLLGRVDGPTTLPALHTTATDSKHADARAFAMQALVGRGKPESNAFAQKALRDADRRVRTFAAQLLAATKPAFAAAELADLVARVAAADEAGAPTDVQVALLALHDLRASDRALAVAAALDDSTLTGCGDALAFLCQGLVPTLAMPGRLTGLQALATHREEAVRRFALTALASYRDPASVAVLQARAAVETGPLQQVAADALAAAQRTPAQTDLKSQAKQNLAAIATAVTGWWQRQSPTRQLLAVAAPSVLLVAVIGLLAAMRRRRRLAAEQAAAAAAALALVQPSDEYLERAEAEAAEFAAAAEGVADEIGLEPAAQPTDAEAWDAHAPSAR